MTTMTIESIPSEIIAMILREYIHAIDIHPYTNLPSVLYVCRRWRMLALEDANCWSMISVTESGPYESGKLSYNGVPGEALDIRLLKWLSRARNHPLDITLWSAPMEFGFEFDVVSTDWKLIISKLANTPRFNTYWESESLYELDLLPSFPPESFHTLTHLRVDSSNIPEETVPLPQLKVLCSRFPPLCQLLCPLLENFTIAPHAYGPFPVSLDRVVETVQSFPKVEKLVFDEIYWKNIPSESTLKCHYAFSKIRHLAVGSVPRGTLLDLLSCFSSASTLTISDITHIRISVPFNGKNLKELVLLEHPSWQRGSRKDARWQESLAWRFFDCLSELRIFRIGREMHFEDHRFKFHWPHLRNSSEVRWLPRVLSAVLCALGPRKERDSTLLPFRCPELEHIHLTCIHLDETFIEYLMDCLRLRHEHKDAAIQKTCISITTCTSDIGATAAFPDVSGLSYPEFKEVFDKHDAGSTILGCLFGMSRLEADCGDSPIDHPHQGIWNR